MISSMFTFSDKISCAGYLGLSLAISSQFSVKMCAASRNCEKNHYKTSIGGFKVIDLTPIKSLSLLFVMISSMSVSATVFTL